MLLTALTTSSVSSTVTATSASLGAMAVKQTYLFASSTNCWIRQGTAKLITCVAKASLATGDFMSIGIAGGTKSYEFDLTGAGVTIAGNVQVNVSTDTTAANVAARLRTAILANQSALTVTDNADGTLTVIAPDLVMTMTETVVNAGFTIGAASMVATAASGSMFVPAVYSVTINGDQGTAIGVIRDTADGKAALTHCKVF